MRQGGPRVSERPEALYYQAQARAALDQIVRIEVCASHAGYSRGCTSLTGRPFGAKPMAAGHGAVELHRGLGGTLVLGDVAVSAKASLGAAPHPYRGGMMEVSITTAGLEVGADGETIVEIFSVSGRLVRTLARERWGAGIHRVQWDGRDDAGRGVVSGAYYLRARGPGIALETKVLVVR